MIKSSKRNNLLQYAIAYKDIRHEEILFNYYQFFLAFLIFKVIIEQTSFKDKNKAF